MLFNSWQFLLFFPTVVGLYFVLPYRRRWILLLVASYFFYMCSVPGYAILLFGSTVVDYFAAIAISKTESKRTRLLLLMTSLGTNLGLLFTFKYFNFFCGSVEAAAHALGVTLKLPQADWGLPVGISFYTFQTLSYSIDVFNDKQSPERHFGRFALFVSFFPQLVAGPIERSSNFLPQLYEKFDFDYERVVSGLRLMGWGLFKKVVIADQLALLVNTVYNDPHGLNGVHFVTATVFFAFQIYCDFSGYSDIAIGAAKVLGFRLMTNFDQPYSARSISEFWSRWHISLTTWFRDYLYIPLGGNRVAVPRWYLNLIIVFVVSGLWHGAKWTFVMWGLLHGLYLVFSLTTRPFREILYRRSGLNRWPRLHAALQRTIVFTLVCFAWIFFRADSLANAWYIISRLHVGWSQALNAHGLRSIRDQLGISEEYAILAAVLLLVLHVFQRINSTDKWPELHARQPWMLRWAFYVALLLAIINLGAQQPDSFIYFQF